MLVSWPAVSSPRAVPRFGKGAPFCLLRRRTTDLVAAGTWIVLKPGKLLRSSSLIYLKNFNHEPGEVAQVFFLYLKHLKHLKSQASQSTNTWVETLVPPFGSKRIAMDGYG